MSLYYEDDFVTLYHGDCIEVMRTIPDNSVDSIVTDPPYGLGFMGKAWDALPPGEDWARECLRVLKPGGHLLAFGGSRTWHRLAVAVEDAGFEIRDSIFWLYGSGFPKHRTALKPACEPIVMARKPYKGSLTANEAKHGTGALDIDGCRIGVSGGTIGGIGGGSLRFDGFTTLVELKAAAGVGGRCPNGRSAVATLARYERQAAAAGEVQDAGRWPANVVLDEWQADAIGDPQKFFYVAKAPKSERPVIGGISHPTVKPLELMRWLVRLVTPGGGVVLDPFAGSGTTLEACLLEGYRHAGIERESEYLPLILARIDRNAA